MEQNVKRTERRISYFVVALIAVALTLLYFIFRFPVLTLQKEVYLKQNVDPKEQLESIIDPDESSYNKISFENVETDEINAVALYRIPVKKLPKEMQKEVIIFNEGRAIGTKLSDRELKEIAERFNEGKLTNDEKDIIEKGRVKALPFIKGNKGGFISSDLDFYSDIVDDRDAFAGYIEVPKTYLEHNDPEDENVQIKMNLNEKDESSYVTVEDYDRGSWGMARIKKGIREISESFSYIVYNPDRLDLEFKEPKFYQKGDKITYERLLEDNIKNLDSKHIYYIVSDDVKALEKGELGEYQVKFIIVSKDGRFRVVEKDIKIEEPEKPNKEMIDLESKLKKKAEEIKKQTKSGDRPDLIEKILEYLEMELRHSKEMLEWMYRSLIEFYPDSKKD